MNHKLGFAPASRRSVAKGHCTLPGGGTATGAHVKIDTDILSGYRVTPKIFYTLPEATVL